ncbi:hypothetical protein ACWD5Q_10365 [Streptomyces sp. NPDC002513]
MGDQRHGIVVRRIADTTMFTPRPDVVLVSDSGGEATVKYRAGHEVPVGGLSGFDRTSVASDADAARLRSWIVSSPRS